MPVRSGALIIWSAPTPSTQWLILHRYAELLELATQQNLLPVAATASGETIPVFDMMVIGVGDDGHVRFCEEIKVLWGIRAESSRRLHAIDAMPARWRGGVGPSLLDGASTAACSRHTA